MLVRSGIECCKTLPTNDGTASPTEGVGRLWWQNRFPLKNKSRTNHSSPSKPPELIPDASV
jgi:hypothetical protein